MQKNSELSFDNYEKLFQEYGKNLYWISLTGGEVSLYEKFLELVLLIKKYCPNLTIVTFTTNGLLPEKICEYASFMRENLSAKIFVTVSLDGPEKLHDKIRGVQNNYFLANLTLHKLKEIKIKAHFGLTVNNLNSSFYAIHNIDPDVKAISLVHTEGIYNKQNNINDLELMKSLLNIVSNYKIRSIGEFIEYLYIRLSIVFLKNERKINPVPCESLFTSIHITPQGEVKPCMYLESLGNIKELSLFEILKSSKAQKSLEEIRKDICPKCWMNCYAPHSMLLHPLKTISAL